MDGRNNELMGEGGGGLEPSRERRNSRKKRLLDCGEGGSGRRKHRWPDRGNTWVHDESRGKEKDDDAVRRNRNRFESREKMTPGAGVDG